MKFIPKLKRFITTSGLFSVQPSMWTVTTTRQLNTNLFKIRTSDLITNAEVKLLIASPLEFKQKLLTKSLTIHDVNLVSDSIQQTFYLEEMLPDSFGYVRSLMYKLVENKFMPHIINGTLPVVNSKVSVHYLHAREIINFCDSYVNALRTELCTKHFNDGRYRYSEILSNGLTNFRMMLMVAKPEWHELINLQDFAEVHKEFIAQRALRAEIMKYKN